MNKTDICYLVELTYKKDEYGITRPTEKKEKRFCRVKSASAQEFFETGQQGIKPQYQITLHKAEYKRQQMVEYNGVQYVVYRTYEPNASEIELYLEERVNES